MSGVGIVSKDDLRGMIRKILYLALIGFSLIWGARNVLGLDPGIGVNLTRYLPEIAFINAIPPIVSLVIGWSCLGLTALAYIIGLVKVYLNAGQDPWRAILFSVALIVVGIGGVFYWMQLSGLIDSASLNLIAVMVAPFTPALLVLPFITTFKAFLAYDGID